MDHGPVVVQSAGELQALAATIVKELTAGSMLLLYGELGAGKTTFVQGLARALGITDSVTSPTFVIASEYTIQNHPTITTLVHVDLYRLQEGKAANDPAVRDVVERASDPGRLTVIEWADRLGEDAPASAHHISFEHGKTPTERIVTFS